ncbi:MAG: hypothetical protein U0354_01360 [Candidatus Sericytochromatia bacterium]
MTEINYNEDFDPIELIKLKFIELKDSQIGKYFFLYFLHLAGVLDYKEKDGDCTFSNSDNIFNVSLPVVDSEETYRELERVHKNLEKFFSYLKSQVEKLESLKINLLDI